MTVDNLPKLAPIEIGYRVDPALPIIPFAMEVSRAGCAAPHAHPRGQFIYASSGVMRVVCRRDVWVVPPSQGVWVPPEVDHEVYFPGDVSLRNLFVDPSRTAALPVECAVLKVSPLLRELIVRAVEVGDDYRPETPPWRLMMVVLDELACAEKTPLHLPMGRDERLLRVMEALLREPGDRREIEAWAAVAGASVRTLSRLFQRETGLSYGAWRKRLLLQTALDRLDRGESVTTVAFDLGYQSLSAFIEMFRQALGAPPGQYARQSGQSTSTGRCRK
ncbi:AraC family transcriptional regulator [Geomesophilobacter sediminis]|uniref:Helix-turn-helix transcriptional regulator n=1 Tax=Geomesophilobacter sediminis TaxID=2798584 RepID=A0A8J7JEC2_9BACT|nr:helix-turn-helix transcriptional regulator [Geomesophilobacter sediminis]MBJ6725903.1 helix-turn-helix transcriptional regulator [Geomesophilobacter sediminis]